MDITSTPFIRNDYWPDYNELNELNGRINEVENELSLTNINLTDKIENVEGNLNAYISQQNNTVITNNVVVNNINANYATGDFLNFNNVNLDNVYVENLTVNKPVFDITLNTPHIDNITVTGGNIFNTNIVNCEINTDNITVNNLNVADGFAERLATNELIINKNIEPIASSAVLGYDATGKVIPVRATYDVSFPEDANYLFTDHFGTAFAGTAETEVVASDNLITANAVYNETLNIASNTDNLRNDMNNELNIVNNNFANIDNNFNDVNNSFNDVNNSFNDVNNSFNDGFNDVANKLNEANNTISSLQDKIRMLTLGDANWYWSGAPVNYQNVTRIVFGGNAAGTQISGKYEPVNIAFNSTSNTLEFHSSGFKRALSEDHVIYTQPNSLLQIFNKDISHLFENCKQLNFLGNSQNSEFNFNFCESTGNFITNMAETFNGCSNFDQNVQIPDSVTNMYGTFRSCSNFNQNIQIPDSVTDMRATFSGCKNFNQNVQIPDNVTDMSSTFSNSNFNQNVQIPDNVTDMSSTFYECNNFNQNIHIPNSVTNMYTTFYKCNNFNQNILIPNSVTFMGSTFSKCNNFNQNILIPNSVTSMQETFYECNNFNQNIFIPNSVTSMNSTFTSCTNFSQNIAIPNSVTDMWAIFFDCKNFNQPDIYIYSQNIARMCYAFNNCHINNIHVPTSVPKDTSNFMYNCLVNGNTGITFPAANIFNDLPVDIGVWPPEA